MTSNEMAAALRHASARRTRENLADIKLAQQWEAREAAEESTARTVENIRSYAALTRLARSFR